MKARSFFGTAVWAWAALSIALAEPLGAQATPDAGPDQTVVFPLQVELLGSVQDRSVLTYVTGDLDNAFENSLVRFEDGIGATVLSPPTTSGGLVYGWPSDIVDVLGETYAIETGFRLLYRLDLSSSLATPLGPAYPPGSWEWITCLAYDSDAGLLYGVDAAVKRLLVFNLVTGAVTPTGAVLTASEDYFLIKGLAYDPSSQLLYAYDDYTETIFTIDPGQNAATSHVLDLPNGSNSLYDELTFYRGRLFGMYRWQDVPSGIWHAQLHEIDLSTGMTTPLGDELVDLSAHALLMQALPEDFQWSQISGPGQVVFSADDVLDPVVSFPEEGVYELALTVFADSGPLSDTLVVTVDPSAVTYCSGKTNSQGCVPFLSYTGAPSATQGPFLISAEDVLADEIGFYLYSTNGKADLGYHGGKLCIKSPFERWLPAKVAKQSGDPPCAGMIKRDFCERIQSGIDPLLTPGQVVTAQLRQRDPLDPAGFGDGLTDAIRFVIQP